MKIVGIIFALMFTGGGLMIGHETVWPTYQSWRAMQQWQPTTASILSLRAANNDTIASYQYNVNGKTFKNDRVYVAPFKDNIGSYHKNKFNELNHLKKNQQPVKIWFNEKNPAESVIDRNMRWGLFIFMVVFCSIFIIIGLTVAYALMTSENKAKGKKLSLTELRKEWNEKCNDPTYEESFIEFVNHRRNESENIMPVLENVWLEKKEWRENRIRSDARSSMWGAWIFALLWLAISSPAVIFGLEEELKKGNYAILIALLFPLVGLFLLKVAWNVTREWKRFGIIELVMDPFPGSIGGHVGGTLHINNLDVLDHKYKVELECVYTYMSGSGKNRSRKENIKWFESGFARIVPTLDGIDLRFRFDVPDDLPEADIEQSGDYTFWRLKVSAEIPGVDLQREYNIPVFKTGVKSNYVQHNISAQVEELKKEAAEEIESAFAQGDLLSTPLARALRFEDQNNKLSFYYPMFRNKFLTIFSLIFAVGFTFAAYSMNDSFGGSGAMSTMITLFSIPFALVGLIATIAAIYLPFNSLRVSIAQRTIKATRSLFLIPVKRNVVHVDDVIKMSFEKTGSTGQGAKRINHYKIIVYAKNKVSFKIAEGIDGKELASQFKDFLYERLTMS